MIKPQLRVKAKYRLLHACDMYPCDGMLTADAMDTLYTLHLQPGCVCIHGHNSHLAALLKIHPGDVIGHSQDAELISRTPGASPAYKTGSVH